MGRTCPRAIGRDRPGTDSPGEATLAAPEARPGTLGMRCETIVARAGAPQVLVAEAERTAADLVEVRSRGLGPIRSTLLGSISQEVVDLAPCSVLVARTPAVSRIILGTDGSPSAEAAERFLGRLAIAGSVPVTVVSVAEILRPLAIGIAPTCTVRRWPPRPSSRPRPCTRTAGSPRRPWTGCERMALTRPPVSLTGDPAAGLLAAATDAGAGLIVVGSRGQTGLKRLALGSVARRVVQHAEVSVLVARTRMTR